LTSEESTEYRDLNEALEIIEAAIEYGSNADIEDGGCVTTSQLPSTQVRILCGFVSMTSQVNEIVTSQFNKLMK